LKYNQKFRHVRTLRGYTLDELADKCGLSKTYLSQIELGQRRPSMKSLERISKALKADATFFMDDNATTFEELAKVSGYTPPDDIMKFVTDQDKLSYIVLAKELSDEGISAESFRQLVSNIKQFMKSLK
jgi:transcriptional regulator with XRE-family HTH domain